MKTNFACLFKMKTNFACLFLCQLIACIMHDSVEAICHGDDYDEIFQDGERATVTCPTGYHLIGPSETTCRNGEWVPPGPFCHGVCSRPGTQSVLQIRPSKSSYVEGDVINYSCNGGYILQGAASATCRDRTFNPSEVPECKRICPRPTSPQPVLRFKVRSSEPVYIIEDDVITYSCDEGYTLHGTVSATCTDRGGFSPSDVPTCKAKCVTKTEEIYEHGNRVSFYCKTGYQLQGPSTSTCNDGEWIPQLPSCRRICNRPTYFNFNLKITPSQLAYLEGDNVTYSCKSDYRLYGATKATCTKTGYFHPRDVPECEENLQCHTGKQTVCEPSGSKCNEYSSSGDNVQQSVETCDDDVKLCFIYQFGVQGESVTVNYTTSGCVNDLKLDTMYGCYNRSYLELLDSSAAEKLEQLEDSLNGRADDVQVCYCYRDECNESVETAARNDAGNDIFNEIMILASVMACLFY